MCATSYAHAQGEMPPSAKPTSSTAAPQPVTTPEQRKEAEAHYQKALNAFEGGDYAKARESFQHAYELVPSFRILYNIGLAETQLRNDAAALDAFERYLAEGGTQISEQRRADVSAEVERLRAKVTTERAEAAATAQNNPEMGPVTQVPSEEPAPAEPLASEPEPTPKSGSKAPLVAWTVTGALAVATATTGILTLSAQRDENALKGRVDVRRSEFEDARSKVSRFALVTDVLFGLTAVSAGVSIYLTLTPSKKREQTARTIELRPLPSGVLVRGTF
jgi:hypothetical protein